MVVSGVFSLLCVFCLFVCTVTDFSAAAKIGVLNYACVFDCYPDRSSPKGQGHQGQKCA